MRGSRPESRREMVICRGVGGGRGRVYTGGLQEHPPLLQPAPGQTAKAPGPIFAHCKRKRTCVCASVVVGSW